MLLPGPDGLRCCLVVRERFLREEPAAHLLSEIRAGRQSRWMLPFIPLMKVDDNSDIVASWLELWNLESDERVKSEIAAIAQTFMQASEAETEWTKALEGLNVQKSAFLESIRTESRGEGRQEGRIADRIESIIETLRQKFPNELDPELISTLEQMHELDRLRQWFQFALNATSMEGFRQACGI
jgi:predicted transposase YdaD